MIKYNLPGFVEQFYVYKFFLELKALKPYVFRDNVSISTVFGNFQYCVWDGGRNFSQYRQFTQEEMKLIQSFYETNNIPVRFIFTNSAIEEKHLYDRFCNLQMEMFHTGQNEVVVNSPILEEYLRNKYPNYKFISSTTKCLNQKQLLEELKNPDYYQVCLDYNLNKDEKLLQSIPIEDRDKCEFLVNAICGPKCPIRKKHYYYTSRAALTYGKEKYDISKGCQIKNCTNDKVQMFSPNNLSFEEIEELNKQGFNYFKLEGRTLHSGDFFTNLVYYMIKPEYVYEIFAEATYNAEGIFFNDFNSNYQTRPNNKFVESCFVPHGKTANYNCVLR